MNKNIILFSNGCPNCITIKRMLNNAKIEYEENNSIDEMVSLGINNVPVLSVDGVLYSYKYAKEYIKNLTEVIVNEEQ